MRFQRVRSIRLHGSSASMTVSVLNTARLLLQPHVLAMQLCSLLSLATPQQCGSPNALPRCASAAGDRRGRQHGLHLQQRQHLRQGNDVSAQLAEWHGPHHPKRPGLAVHQDQRAASEAGADHVSSRRLKCRILAAAMSPDPSSRTEIL